MDIGELKFSVASPRFRGLPFALKETVHRLNCKFLVFEHEKGWITDRLFVKIEGPYENVKIIKNWIEELK